MSPGSDRVQAETLVYKYMCLFLNVRWLSINTGAGRMAVSLARSQWQPLQSALSKALLRWCCPLFWLLEALHPFWCTPWLCALVSCDEKCAVFHHCVPILYRGTTYHWNQIFFLSFYFFSFSYCDFGSDSKKLIHCVGLHCNLQPAHSIPRFRFQLSPAASTFSWQLFWLLHPKNAPDIKSAGATHGLEHVSENFTHCIVVALAYFTSNGNLVFMRTLIFLPFRCLLKSLNADFSM